MGHPAASGRMTKEKAARAGRLFVSLKKRQSILTLSTWIMSPVTVPVTAT